MKIRKANGEVNKSYELLLGLAGERRTEKIEKCEGNGREDGNEGQKTNTFSLALLCG